MKTPVSPNPHHDTIPGITRPERSEFDEALWYYKTRAAAVPGAVLNFRGVPIDQVKWTERDKIRVVLEYRKDTENVVMRNGHATVFAKPMRAAALPEQEI